MGARTRAAAGCPERRPVADAFESKYGVQLTAPEGTWSGLGDAIRDGTTLLYRVDPTTAFGFGKGSSYSQTRWQFDRGPLAEVNCQP